MIKSLILDTDLYPKSEIDEYGNWISNKGRKEAEKEYKKEHKSNIHNVGDIE